MENIRQAVELARAGQGARREQPERVALNRPQVPPLSSPGRVDRAEPRAREVELKGSYLHSKRIICQDGADPRAKSFDMLRTQVLRVMDSKGWQILGVTSPSAGCGKTLTAVNLAISIARQPERSVLLVDLDLQKPQVASCLGWRSDTGVRDVLEGRVALSDAIVEAKVADHNFLVLPTEAPLRGSSEWMASRAMSTMLQNIKKEYPSRVVIVDLPPLLVSDDVIAILPRLDCALLVAAVGMSTIPEIEECNRHLQTTDVVRIVLNKVTDVNAKYYYY